MEHKYYTGEQILEALSEVGVGAGDISEVMSCLGRMPSAEPVIRCKDCKHYNAEYECLIEGYGIERDKDWFCGDAERKEDE